MLLFPAKLKVIYGASTMFFETPQQAWQWVTEKRELHPRSGPVAVLMDGSAAQPPRPSREARERRQRSKRRHPWHGGGGDASARLAPGMDRSRMKAQDSSLLDTPAIFTSDGGPP
ncbi:hypothetical protein NDU88_004999 [Pleurodeles waltl]|uniref:Uncharacterized protein n=1 Tax=Pleurodeles waltl TaxID=8319 RepID=A0AAV7MWR4_PLEWA|nr:hypothetical protein NDU88_004999 [Pleurodeles waltl]